MKKFLQMCCGLLLLIPLVSCESNPQQLTALRPNDVILAFGDSLTLGVGTEARLSYPAQLDRLLGRRVINAGVSGEISAEAVRRLPALLDKYEPELLILCHGGNDIVRKLDQKELQDNLRRMVETAKQRDIDVVMIAVPQPNLLISDASLYAELAEEMQIPLLEKALGELLSDSQYKSDALHLNAQGYRKFAEAVADLLAQNGAL
ncbi:MAG: GDSL-type esterase/lipase family protein [Deltaproteobacteria bacterium]|jgi:lysophospholipase L1-like esterase|nr:GDSL-type esterase/lipase family protein [Deltaproteobacteria bacterium]MCW9049959.1 GDSL-type esterase/lipase family protein [Deltaproteobacteria bacterium]